VRTLASVLVVIGAGAGTAGALAPPVSNSRLRALASCTRPVVLRAGESVPAWRLGAIHFLSTRVGVGLTAPSVPCATPIEGGYEVGVRRQTTLLAFTGDGGRRWTTRGAALPEPPPGVQSEQIVAISREDVWAYSGSWGLMATTTGGENWTVQPVPGPITALAITGPTLWALGCPQRNNAVCHPALSRRRLPNGPWQQVHVPWPASRQFPQVSAPTPQVILRWASRPDPSWMGRPCSVAEFAATGAENWWVLCLGGAAAGSSTKALLHSTDAGGRWGVASQLTSLTAPPRPGSIPLSEPVALAAGSPTRLWLSSPNSMAESGDGGTSWTDVAGVNPQGWTTGFDVLSPTRAWLLAPGQGLWRTSDGSRWYAVGAGGPVP
jgi:hypothetical protein